MAGGFGSMTMSGIHSLQMAYNLAAINHLFSIKPHTGPADHKLQLLWDANKNKGETRIAVQIPK
jgi:hypothetical protein